MKKRIILYPILAVFVVLAMTACGSVGSAKTLTDTNPSALTVNNSSELTAPTQIPDISSSDPVLAAFQGTLENIYTTVSPSVVNIQVVQKVDSSTSSLQQSPGFPFFNLPQDQQPPQQYQSALGSGFIWDQNGNIVTNNHVVADADKIQVTFSDGTILPASLVGADPDSDLAVINVDAPKSLLQPVTMGDSRNLKVGQMAIAIGNPFGLEGTMTTGIVSALGRSLPADENAVQSYTIPDVIQTDASINPGNSGGVLVDTEGRVLGVTSAIESPVGASAGIGFAIPSAIVNNVVPALITDGTFVHPWVGISGMSLFPDIAKAMNLDANQRGALVGDVMSNSPAEKAGLQGSTDQTTIDGQTVNIGGDVITAIDSQTVSKMDDLITYLFSHTKVGQTVTLTIIRDGKQKQLDLTLAARPSAEERANTDTQTSTRGITLGIQGMTVDKSIIDKMNLPNDQQGVLVIGVESGSLAEKAGIQGGSETVTLNGQTVKIGGDIITQVNQQPIAGIEELKAALAQQLTNQEFELTILRGDKTIQIVILPGE